MRQKIFFFLFLLSIRTFPQSGESFNYFPHVAFDPKIPTPQEVLGFAPGEWHVSYDQLLIYMKSLAETSERITINEIAKSHEGRPLIQLTITSAENHANLEKIKKEHQRLSKPAQANAVNTSKMPIVIWLGYSIHGNEASGSNAAMLVGYYLAAATGKEVENILSNAVIILDPCYNPDGLQRFSTWTNMHRSTSPNGDPNDREHHEMWPTSRTNHYWFDLNRDWLPLVHPESRGRIARFHEWKPNILTDHHEMGKDKTFFFQPGIPSRNNPLTPQKNVTLSQKMAKYHAEYLDEIGSLYFSQESFDDYYVGKGSTYPDINGCVGILFEQASPRGHLQENSLGTISFHQAIQNQIAVSLSTITAGVAHRVEFLEYQKEFYATAKAESSRDQIKAYVFGSDKTKIENYELLKILTQHGIESYHLKKELNINGKRFVPDNAFVVPLDQPQYRLAKATFETRTEFQDSLFYDVSSWTLPLAFNVPYVTLDGRGFSTQLHGAKIESLALPTGKLVGKKGAYAYAIQPHHFYSFRAVHRLLQREVVVQVLNKSHSDANRSYPRGTIIIPMGIQEEKRQLIESEIDKMISEDRLEVFSLSTGLATDGVDLGSPSNSTLTELKVALLVEEGVNAYEAGEVWHLLDKRLNMPVTLLPIQKLSMDLSRYNRIIIPEMRGAVSAGKIKGLKKWISEGGTVITWKNGGKWISDNGITNVKYKSETPLTIRGSHRYADISKSKGAQLTKGAILEAKIDLTHPLSYGMVHDRIPVFRDHNLVMEKSTNLYANPLSYAEKPLMAGYVSKENLERFSSAPALTISNVGKGRVITFSDNPNFRGFWWGTNKLFFNALFLGETINRKAAE